MGCGISQDIEKQIEDYQVKINEISEVNTELTQQIEKLKSSKYKRKPVYVVADQEIDELFVFKTDLDKRFESIDTDLNKIRIQLGGQDVQIKQKKQLEYPSENQWLEALENNDNEITQKPFQGFDDISQSSQKDQKNKESKCLEQSEVSDMKKTLPKQEKTIKNQSELSKQLADALGDELKEMHDGLKNKLFFQTAGVSNSQVEQENKSKSQNQIIDSSNSKSAKNAIKNQSNVIVAPQTDKIKRKSAKANSGVDKAQLSQQQFYSKQQIQEARKKKKK